MASQIFDVTVELDYKGEQARVRAISGPGVDWVNNHLDIQAHGQASINIHEAKKVIEQMRSKHLIVEVFETGLFLK